MRQPTSIETTNAAYIVGAMTNGGVMGVLSPSDRNIAEAAALAASFLAKQPDPFPSSTSYEDGVALARRTGPAGIAFEQAVAQVVAFEADRAIKTDDNAYAKAIIGGFRMQADAQQVMLIVNGNPGDNHKPNHQVIADAILNMPAEERVPIRSTLSNQSGGRYSDLSEREQADVFSDITSGRLSTSEAALLNVMAQQVEKPAKGAYAGWAQLDFNEEKHLPRTMAVLENRGTTGFSAIDDSLRVLKETAVLNDMQLKLVEKVDKFNHEQALNMLARSGARLVDMAEKGREFAPAQSAMLLINDLNIMSIARQGSAMGRLHLLNTDRHDQQHLEQGQYAKLSETTKTQIYQRLNEQTYVAPLTARIAVEKVSEESVKPSPALGQWLAHQRNHGGQDL